MANPYPDLLDGLTLYDGGGGIEATRKMMETNAFFYAGCMECNR